MRLTWFSAINKAIVGVFVAYSVAYAAGEQSLRYEDGSVTADAISRHSNDNVEFKTYPTAEPGWHASVAYVYAFINSLEMYQDRLVAPCGDSGRVAYISFYVAPLGNPRGYNVGISTVDLRTGTNVTSAFKLSRQDLTAGAEYTSHDRNGDTAYLEDQDLTGIACSPDGMRVVLSFEATLSREFWLKKNFLLDMKTQSVTSLGETKLSKRIAIDGRVVNPSFSLLLGGKENSAIAERYGIRTLPIEEVQAAIQRYHGLHSMADVLLYEDSVSVVASYSQAEEVVYPETAAALRRQPITLIRMSGKDFRDTQVCHIENFKYVGAHPNTGGLIVELARLRGDQRVQAYLIKPGARNGAACELMRLHLFDSKQVVEAAGDGKSWVQVTEVLPVPQECDLTLAKTYKVDFTLSRPDRTTLLFAPQIKFGCHDAWHSVESQPGEQFTFVYGPHNGGTALVHLWKPKLN